MLPEELEPSEVEPKRRPTELPTFVSPSSSLLHVEEGRSSTRDDGSPCGTALRELLELLTCRAQRGFSSEQRVRKEGSKLARILGVR